MKNTTRAHPSDLLSLVTGGLTTLLGLAVLAGWHTHDLRLLQVYPGFVAMAYNTALGFSLSGAALLGALFGRPRLAAIGSGIVALIGLLTLSEYLSGMLSG